LGIMSRRRIFYHNIGDAYLLPRNSSDEFGCVSLEEKRDQPVCHNLKSVFISGEHSQFECLPEKPCDGTFEAPMVDFTHSEHKTQRGHVPPIVKLKCPLMGDPKFSPMAEIARDWGFAVQPLSKPFKNWNPKMKSGNIH
jgi:hypothetical protein